MADEDKKFAEAAEKIKIVLKSTDKLKIILGDNSIRMIATPNSVYDPTLTDSDYKWDNINDISMVIYVASKSKGTTLEGLITDGFLECENNRWFDLKRRFNIGKYTITEKKKTKPKSDDEPKERKTIREKLNDARAKAAKGIKEGKGSKLKTAAITTLVVAPVVWIIHNIVLSRNSSTANGILNNNGKSDSGSSIGLDTLSFENSFDGLSEEQIIQNMAAVEVPVESQPIYNAEDFTFDTLRADKLDTPDAIGNFINLVSDYAVNNPRSYPYENLAAESDKETIRIITGINDVGLSNPAMKPAVSAVISDYINGDTTEIIFNGIRYRVVPYNELYFMDHLIPTAIVVGNGDVFGNSDAYGSITGMYNGIIQEAQSTYGSSSHMGM